MAWRVSWGEQKDIGKETNVAAGVQKRGHAGLWTAALGCRGEDKKEIKQIHYMVQSLWSFFFYSILTSMESSTGFNLSQLVYGNRTRCFLPTWVELWGTNSLLLGSQPGSGETLSQVIYRFVFGPIATPLHVIINRRTYPAYGQGWVLEPSANTAGHKS